MTLVAAATWTLTSTSISTSLSAGGGTTTESTPGATSNKIVAAVIATPAAADNSDIVLEDEEKDAAPVLDFFDEVQRKISIHLKKDGVTQAQFCWDVSAQLLRGQANLRGVSRSADVSLPDSVG